MKQAQHPRTKNPRGGLTKAGRDKFHKQTGANLQPGVKKPESQMSRAEMRRKGSWATRFYGRSVKLPPLKTKHGKPTRFALMARAWGEAIPKTVAAARAIALKGRKLLRKARDSKW